MKVTPRAARIAVALSVVISATAAQATILDDFNNGNIITEFNFDDAQGTEIPDTFNSGSLGGSFDTDGDTAGVVTTGTGVLDASTKANTAFGSHYVDLPTISEGRIISLADITWDFDESVYDDTQEEEFRLTMISNDPRGTFTTTQIFFERTSATEWTLFGDTAGAGGVDTSPDIVFGSSGSAIVLIDLDIQSRVFELWYSTDGGTSFLSGGTGMTGDFNGTTPGNTRPVSSFRIVLNEDFSDDVFTVNRVGLSIPEPSALVLLAAGFFGLARRR